MAHEPVSLYNFERQALTGQLRDVSPRLAGLYRRLIRLLDEEPGSDERLAWASLIGHCVRELINRLPDVLADVPDMLNPVKPKSSELVQRLPALAERHADVLGNFSGPTPENGDGQAVESVPVPRPLFEALQRISDATEQETARALERDAVVVARARAASGPAYDRWRTARKFFMDFTHLDNHIGQDERPLPSDEEILEHLQTIELTLSSRLTKFFDNRRNLDEFLAEVNKLSLDQDPEIGSRYVPPVSRGVVRDVLTRIGSLQLRRVFYGGMQNPLWVSALAEEGAFKSPPEPRKDNEGNVREEPWPEMDYLVRMARGAPREVVDVGLTLIKSKNSWVRRGLVEIAATVPTEDAARLAAGLRRWGSNDFGWRTDPRHLVMMTENLLVGGEFALGMKFASGLFHPKKPKSRVPLDSGFVVGLEEYWYDQSLPQIAAALGENGLGTLVLWLESYEKLTGRFNEETGSDFSYMGRPDIASRQTGAPDIEGALIDAVRDATLGRVRIAPADTVGALMRSKQPLLKRICLFAVRDALTNAELGALEALAFAARPLVHPQEFGQPEFRIEFSGFLRALAAAAGPDELLPLTATLECGPLGSVERLKERLRSMGTEDNNDLDAAAEAYAAQWRHRLLASVGSEALPDELREQLQVLDQRFGEIKGPHSSDFAVTKLNGLESPMSHSDMIDLKSGELLRHLETWHPDAEAWHAPSHEGQGRELTTAISHRPDLFDGQTEKVVALRPTYLRAILRGWQIACGGERLLPWTTVGTVIQQTAVLPNESPFNPEGRGRDDDHDYLPAKAAAVRLLETMVKRHTGDSAPPEAVVVALAPTILGLVKDPRLQTDYVTTPVDGMDPIMISINRPLPMAVRALVALVRWNGLSEGDGPIIKALDGLLERDDPHGAIAAVFGESLAILYTHAPSWIQANAPRIFGGKDGQDLNQQIALSTALSRHYIHPQLLELLRGPIGAALGRTEPLAVGGRSARGPGQMIGDWIVVTYIRGDIDRDDDLMRLFFDSANIAARGDVLGHIAWTFMHADSVVPDILKRAGELWDWRVAHAEENAATADELNGFFWFVKCGKFPVDWWVPRLRRAIALSPSVGAREMIHEQLAEASKHLPGPVLDIVRGLTAGADEQHNDQYMLIEHAVPQVIASALDSHDDEIGAEATALMHELGERGYINLDAQVSALRQS